MRIGFIGAGNMGTAIIKGILSKRFMDAHDIFISRKRPELSAELVREGVQIAKSNTDLVRSVDCVVLAVKPVYAAQVLGEVYDAIAEKLVISIVAGWTC